MARRKNEILIEWSEGLCQGEINCVNVKHILLDAQDISVGTFVTARLNSRKYRGLVKDLLSGWRHRRRNKRDKQEGARKGLQKISQGKHLMEARRTQERRRRKQGQVQGRQAQRRKGRGELQEEKSRKERRQGKRAYSRTKHRIVAYDKNRTHVSDWPVWLLLAHFHSH